MFRYDIVPLDREWDALLYQMPNWNLFQTSTWMNINASVHTGKNPARGLIFHENGEVFGLLPFVSFSRYGIRIIGSPIWHWMVPFTGFAWKDRLGDTIASFGQYCRSSKTNYCSITLSESGEGHLSPASGRRITTFSTAILPLTTDLDTLWSKVHRNQRNRIRKGERSSYTIIEQDRLTDFDEYLRIRREMFQKQGLYRTRAETFLSEIYSTADPAQFKIFSVMDGQKLAAAFIVVLFRDVCFAFDTASVDGYKQGSHNCTLNWHIIEWAHRNGYKVYDMGGANTPPIAFFKYSFGSVEKKYSMIEIFSPAFLSRMVDRYREYLHRKNPKFRQTIPESERMPSGTYHEPIPVPEEA